MKITAGLGSIDEYVRYVEAGADAVSYTHLDVYKRQVPFMVGRVPNRQTFLYLCALANSLAVSTILTSGTGDTFDNASKTICVVIPVRAAYCTPAAES